MCNQSNLLKTDCNEEGIFSIIKAQSFQKAQMLVKKQFKGKDESDIIQELEKAEKFLSGYVEDNPNEPAQIRLKICKGKFCITFEFLKKYDIDITIQL